MIDKLINLIAALIRTKQFRYMKNTEGCAAIVTEQTLKMEF